MINLFNIVTSNKIHKVDVSLPLHISDEQMNALVSSDTVLECIKYASGTEKVPAHNMVEAIARRDADEDLMIMCEEFETLLHENNLDADYRLFATLNPGDRDDWDLNDLMANILEIEIFHKMEILEAA